MNLATFEFTAPAAWASALLNGDPRGLEFNELIALREHFQCELPHVIDCSLIARIGKFNGKTTKLAIFTAYVPVRPKRLT